MLVKVPNPSNNNTSISLSRSQNLGSIETIENSPIIMKNKKKIIMENSSRSLSKINLVEGNNIQVENNNNNKEKNIPYMTDNDEEKSKINSSNIGQSNSAIIDIFKKNEYEYIVKTMNMVNHSQANPKLYDLAIKLLGYMKRKSKVANETKTLPSWFIDETNIDVLESKDAFIGSGSYCYVQKCIYNGALVAKKTLNLETNECYKETIIDSNGINNNLHINEKELFLREIEIWSRIKSHPNILQFYGACHISQYPSIISEYCSRGTVKTYTSQKNISPEQKLQIMHGIITGLYHLHQNNIIHGDIKSDNILITENGKPKICDFGLSVFQTNQINSNSTLTIPCKVTDAIRWKAPELFSEYKLQNIKNHFSNNEDLDDFKSFDQNNDYSNVIGKISIFSDIFSVGRLFYEIIFQKIPFYDIINEVQVEYMIIHDKYPSKLKVNNFSLENNILYSNKMWDILEKTWNYDPFERISLMTVASLLIQLRNQQLQINNNLKESNKQNDEEMENINNNSLEFMFNSNYDIAVPSNDHSVYNLSLKRESKQCNRMKHSVSVNCIDTNDSNDDPIRHHRRSISNIENNSTQNSIRSSNLIYNNSVHSFDKIKSYNKKNGKIPKSMTMNNIGDINSNSFQIINSKIASIEINKESIRLAKSTNDISMRNEERSHHSSNKLEKPRLCVKIERFLQNEVTKITLDKENISGKIPEEIGNYKTITELCLAYNKIKGSIPDSIGLLYNLTTLRLHGNSLSGKIPETICQLQNLVELRLDHNNFTDELPSSIGDLKKLTHLYLSHNKFVGKIPDKIGNLKNLVHLIMQDNQFTGCIPDSLGNLTNLTHLYLAQNSLKGEIPKSFQNLQQLSVLILNENKLSGEIPEFLCNLSRLNQLWLSYNNFSGSIPNDIGKLTRLKILQLQNNKLLNGPIPESINNLKRLENFTYSNTNIDDLPNKELIQRLKIFEH
ncbi:L domain-like protein [Piromyces finnis]|uniref:L domain-like protein n=1 Tax=Piromyces finnis TaxID=1754191 RepID=A0A1Y1VI49_9FUNG|nr:L domain-like protein [Piromyces finnis]|eukprot:ORX55461.1 L domain-like protein [Piromyces finnis]